MSIKYLTKEELDGLTDGELDEYALLLTAYQTEILVVMDSWVEGYTLTNNEYHKRRANRSLLVANESDTKH